MRVTSLTKDPKRGTCVALHDRGTAAAGAAGTITLQNAPEVALSYPSDNHADIVGAVIVVISGTGAFMAKNVSSYVASTRVATMAANWPVTPDATSGYVIIRPTAAAELRIDKSLFTGVGRNGGIDRIAKILGEKASQSSLIL